MRCSKWLALWMGCMLCIPYSCYPNDRNEEGSPPDSSSTLDLYQQNGISPDPAPSDDQLEVYSGEPEILSLALNSGTPGNGPSLQDLGFSQNQTQGNAQDQALLDKRSHMLQLHQRWGLATTVPLVATILLAPGGKSTTFQRTLHGSLGVLTASMYMTTAYYAFGSPKIPGTKPKGQTRLHKALAWIHFPGMILTPILGAMADEQRNAGEKVHGIASAHGEVAGITIAAYVAAILSVSIKF